MTVESTDPRVVEHCREVERCNQRGGRMLSIVDLIEAGTLTREVAAHAAAAIGAGASFMVGALPGGAGKTTVMGALLNLVPPDAQLVPADGAEAIARGAAAPDPRRCFVCHEIGSGPYYAYLWDRDLRSYCRLADAGHILATNLHADTYKQAHTQVCRDNGVPDANFRRMTLLYFLRVAQDGGRVVRRVGEVWESAGGEPHRRVWSAEAPGGLQSRLADAGALAVAAGFVDELMASGARTIQDVRAAVVARAPRPHGSVFPAAR
jgi:hypothetical protein